jgi:hypothetical protein
MTIDSPPTSPVPAAPPTMPGPLPDRPSEWPKVVGVVCIVIGACGVLMNIWGLINTLVTSTLRNMPGQTQATVAAMIEYRPWMLANALAGLGLSVMLIFAGVGIVGRRGWCVPTARAWSIIRLIHVPLNSYLTYVVQQAMFAAMKNDPQLTASPGFGGAGFGTMTDVVSIVTSVLLIIWGFALPVFLLLWFLRSKISAEVRDWR